jgi:hypothetical protein
MSDITGGEWFRFLHGDMPDEPEEDEEEGEYSGTLITDLDKLVERIEGERNGNVA